MVLKHANITQDIIASFYEVYNKLGYGFQEKVYVNALIIVLRKKGRSVEKEVAIPVYIEHEIVGEYFADLIVDSCVIIECKAVKALLDEHEAQLLNYLKATPIEVGMLLNFGPEAKYMRKAYDNSRKGDLSWVPKS